MKLFFAGDFCSKPSTKEITVSDELRSVISSCDFKIVNFEVPLKPEEIKMPKIKRERFFQHDDAPDFLRGLGFNLFQVANNHAFDWGEQGFNKMVAALGDCTFGAGTYDDAYKVKVVEEDGFKIGFMALSFAAYTGVFDGGRKEGLGCAYINDRRVNHDIIEAKKHVDYLFVLPHDGIEYIDIPMPATIERYRDFIDYGADGVIGTHPHCPQGWEEYKGKPIFYSLGNFLFNSKEGYDYRATNRPHWYEGLCVIISIKDGALEWEVINTRNENNLHISIDHDEKRSKHNKRICNYLHDEKAYDECLVRVCKSLGVSEMSIIDNTFYNVSYKAFFKHIKRRLKCCITGKRSSDDKLVRLLSHDARRDMLMCTLRKIKK